MVQVLNFMHYVFIEKVSNHFNASFAAEWTLPYFAFNVDFNVPFQVEALQMRAELSSPRHSNELIRQVNAVDLQTFLVDQQASHIPLHYLTCSGSIDNLLVIYQHLRLILKHCSYQVDTEDVSLILFFLMRVYGYQNCLCFLIFQHILDL